MKKKNKSGFTLIEMLVVVLIIGILAGIALPQYTKAVEKAKIAEAKINLKAIASAAHLYALSNTEISKDLTELDIEIQGEIIESPVGGVAISTENFTYYVDECLGNNEDSCTFTADRNIIDSNTGEIAYYINLDGPNYDTDTPNTKFWCNDNDSGKTCKKYGAVQMNDGNYYFD